MTTVTYLDEVAASAPGRAYKSRLLDLMDLRPGQTVLDIGCGPGTDLGDLADAAGHAHVRRGARIPRSSRLAPTAGPSG